MTMFSALSSGQGPDLKLFAQDAQPQPKAVRKATASVAATPLSEEFFTDAAPDHLYDTMLVAHPGRRSRLGGRQQDCEPGCQPECEETTTDDLYDKMLREDESKSVSPDTPAPPDDAPSMPPSAEDLNFAPPTTSFASASRNVPALIGDFFGGSQFVTLTGPAFPDSEEDGPTQIPLAMPAGQVKLTENSSPIPRDRILFNYSYFSDVRLAPGGVNVNRFTPGFEKTFLEGDGSLELRVPFATTLDSDITDGVYSTGDVEFGDVMATLKYAFARTDTWVASAGFGMIFPTADDIDLSNRTGQQLLKIENESVHILPYIGGAFAPTERFFVQGIFQIDAPVNGNTVLIVDDPFNPSEGLVRAGKLTPATFMFIDVSTGYWFYRANEWDLENSDGITGVAGIFEIHYNKTLNDFDAINFQGNTVGANNDFEQLNLVAGGLVEVNADASLSFGYAVPVTNDRVFQGEFRCNFTYLFGGSSQRGGAPFIYRNRSL
ncbi:MAG: hypothetical protein WD065_03250 [Planctomycetaceae bacterium]